MTNSKKYNAIIYAVLILCTLVLSVGITYARLSASVSSGSASLTFGQISLDSSGFWTDSESATINGYPTASLISNDIKFSVSSTSNALYLRAKINLIATDSHNDSIIADILEGSIPDTNTDDLIWVYYSTDGYYYLCNTDSVPYKLGSDYTNDVYFLKAVDFVMPDIEYSDLASGTDYTDFASLSITAEAIQTTLPTTISSVANVAQYF